MYGPYVLWNVTRITGRSTSKGSRSYQLAVISGHVFTSIENIFNPLNESFVCADAETIREAHDVYDEDE